jgi:hypothetical protein
MYMHEALLPASIIVSPAWEIDATRFMKRTRTYGKCRAGKAGRNNYTSELTKKLGVIFK